MINIKGLSKRFGDIQALQKITLNFDSKRTHVLLGSSGSGKSTLLRVVMGLIRPDEGSVHIDELSGGISANPMTIGFVIQDGGLFPHLTVEKNILLAAGRKQKKMPALQERIEELLKLTDLPRSALSRYPQELSGGQKQRAALLRALLPNPQILLLDEPLGALDPVVRGSLQSYLKQLFSDLHKTVIFVTHDLNEAAFLGDTVTLMNEGRVVQHGKLEDLVRSPSSDFVTEFLRAQRPAPQLRDLL